MVTAWNLPGPKYIGGVQKGILARLHCAGTCKVAEAAVVFLGAPLIHPRPANLAFRLQLYKDANRIVPA